ncbi:MAG: S-layer homology domain-containing protein, partial [Clostridia bacterium]|nr:S-layer homology domain-containing protein [Clostridia bacterium]
MGSNESVNKKILEIAKDRYGAIIKNYNLSWGENEIAYLMYKGALKKTDLDTYLKDNEKNTPMKRYEAAIIITKAMGGEEKALADLGVVLNYTDAREVPSSSIQYVSYATEAGIMEGMGDGTFSPNTPVKRSQMAVMLSRTVDKTAYTFSKLKLTNIDEVSRTVTAKASNGNEEKFIYSDATTVKSMGEEIQLANLETGVDAVFTFSGDNLVAIDTLSSQPDATVTGVYQNYASTSGKTTVKIIPDGETAVKGYECAADVAITFDGSPATIRSFTKGDMVTLEIVDGKVESLTGETKETKISGAIVENIDITGEVTMTISHGSDAYDGQSFVVSSDVIVKKNDVTVGLDSIYNGDKVTLTLQYGVITKITASSTKKVIEGTIKELTISTQSTMK